MRHKRFGEWTRVERANWKRTHKRNRLRRRVFATLGCALIVFAVLFSLASLRPTVQSGGENGIRAEAIPKDETLRLTVPKMQRVKDIPVYTASPDNNAALDAGAIHVKGTGFPWEKESNVYIAGHRLGYPNTGSFLVFYDLNRLVDGDRVLLRDAEGKEYVYQVFREITVRPDQVSVTRPVAGRKVVSLQACTLPDYSKRLIVQAELVNVRDVPVPTKSA